MVQITLTKLITKFPSIESNPTKFFAPNFNSIIIVLTLVIVYTLQALFNKMYFVSISEKFSVVPMSFLLFIDHFYSIIPFSETFCLFTIIFPVSLRSKS